MVEVRLSFGLSFAFVARCGSWSSLIGENKGERERERGGR